MDFPTHSNRQSTNCSNLYPGRAAHQEFPQYIFSSKGDPNAIALDLTRGSAAVWPLASSCSSHWATFLNPSGFLALQPSSPCLRDFSCPPKYGSPVTIFRTNSNFRKGRLRMFSPPPAQGRSTKFSLLWDQLWLLAPVFSSFGWLLPCSQSPFDYLLSIPSWLPRTESLPCFGPPQPPPSPASELQPGAMAATWNTLSGYLLLLVWFPISANPEHAQAIIFHFEPLHCCIGDSCSLESKGPLIVHSFTSHFHLLCNFHWNLPLPRWPVFVPYSNSFFVSFFV